MRKPHVMKYQVSNACVYYFTSTCKKLQWLVKLKFLIIFFSEFSFAAAVQPYMIPIMRSNLPFGFTLCHACMGFAHSSIKFPPNYTQVLHCSDFDEQFCMVYLLVVADLFDSTLPSKLYFISIKHSIKDGWYFADGARLSTDRLHLTEFITDEPNYERNTEKMIECVQKIVPEMLRRSGVPNMQLLLCLTKYTWSVKAV